MIPAGAPGAPAASVAGGLATAQRGAFTGTAFAEGAREVERMMDSPLLQRRIERALGQGGTR